MIEEGVKGEFSESKESLARRENMSITVEVTHKDP
jgi:hypothetical protein